jgi:hypothetical protein
VGRRRRGSRRWAPGKYPKPYIINPKPLTLNPKPYTLHPTPYTLHPTPYTLHPTPYNPTPYTLHPTPYTLHPTPYTPHPTPYPIYLRPQTLHPKLCIRNPDSRKPRRRVVCKDTFDLLSFTRGASAQAQEMLRDDREGRNAFRIPLMYDS